MEKWVLQESPLYPGSIERYDRVIELRLKTFKHWIGDGDGDGGDGDDDDDDDDDDDSEGPLPGTQS